MTPQDWQKVKDLCALALEKPVAQRRSFLAQACPDEVLRREVESLLAGEVEPVGVFDRRGDDVTLGKPERPIPVTLGPYRVLHLLGEGGMGSVYKVEQDRPHRIVALKVIKPGLATPALLRRFERESEALARLHHSGIAQIYEVGTADAGYGPQPYFAMEFINGEPLNYYAQSHRLNARQWLELMAKVCDAVEHAHQRGIIHRDLKPSNILLDEAGQPKILDFGVARITDSDAQATKQTDIGQLVGTLAYMSPEQVLADPLELDTRSDVYALGVILYELLAARLPYQLSLRLLDAASTIREQDPVPLSSINKAYRGDVETIVAKALEKDKARRYSSAAALAADIRRYLADEPIAARPASAGYHLQKFARRHKALVTATAVVLVVLVGGIAVSTREAMKARRAQQTAQAVNDFLRKDLLAQASAAAQSGPGAKPDPDLKVRTALDRAAARISGKFSGQPEVEAAIRDTIGQTYTDLGLYPDARTQLQQALDLRRRVLGTSNQETLATTSRLAGIAFLQGKYPEAETLAKQAVESQQRLLGSDHPDTLASMNILGNIYQSEGKFAQAEVLNSQLLQIRRRLLGPEHPDTLVSMHNLALIYQDESHYAEAEALGSQALEIRRRVLGPEHPNTLSTMNALAITYYEQGKYAQAEALYSESLEIRRRILGAEHPNTQMSKNNLGGVYNAQGKYAEAEALFSKAAEIQSRVLGPEHLNTLIITNNLAETYAFRGKYDLAEALFSKTVLTAIRVVGPQHPYTLAFISDFASMYQREGKYALAENYATQALSGRRQVMGAGNSDTMSSAADLGLAYYSQGKFSETEPLAREAFDFGRQKHPDDWQRFRAESLLGASLAGEKKYAEAEPLLLEGYQGMAERKERMGVPNWYHLDRAAEWIVNFYEASGNAGQAAEWRRKLAGSESKAKAQ